MQLFGDTLRGEDYYQYSKVGKMAVPGLSDRYLGAIVPSMIDDMGGPSAGAAHMTAFGAIVGGRMKKSAKSAASAYGLMGRDGRMIRRDTFVRDPFEWATTVLEPALARKGKGYDPADPQKFIDTLTTIFSDRNAAEFVGKHVMKSGELRRNEERFRSVKGLDQAEGVREANPNVALESAKTQSANLLGDLFTPMVGPATAALNALADAASGASSSLRSNPEITKGAAPAAAVVGGSLASVLVGRTMQYLAGDAAGPATKMLLHGGRLASGLGSILPWATLPAGAAAGMALEGAEPVNGGLLASALSGQENPTARISRLYGEALEREAKARAGMDAAARTGTPLTFGRPRRSIGSIKQPVTTTLPTSRGAIGDFLLGPDKQTIALPGFGQGRRMVLPDIVDASSALGQELKRSFVRVGTEAGERAASAIADGIKAKTSAVEEQGRFILEKMQGILSEGADLPIRLKVAPGIDKTSLDGFPGGGIVKASFNPGGGMVGGRGGANAFGGSIPPGGALDGTYRGPRAVGSGSGVGHIASQSERAAYIRQSAIARGIDPNVALSVAQSEGFYKYVGDQGRSFGDWQLFTGGGVGNRALQAGINVRDPNTWRQQTDFALDVAKREGWGQWYGAARVGIGRWQGLRGKPPGPVGGPEQAGTFPNGAPRVLKPRSMPDAPGVTMPDRRIPEAPPGGIGGARGTGSLGHVADRMDAAVARMAEMGWRSHHVVEVSAGPGLEARTRGMRVQATGPVRADTGISMPVAGGRHGVG